MIKYTAFIGPTATGYSAHVPDLPGCVAAARTLEETRQLIREAIELYLETLTEEERAAALRQQILTTSVEVHA